MLYADFNATSPLCRNVKEYLLQRLEGPFGNPNSIHSLGQTTRRALEQCRQTCADILGAEPRQVIFNSGASEGISTVFNHVHETFKSGKILMSPIEHSASVRACNNLKEHGFQIDMMEVNHEGVVQLPKNKKAKDYTLAVLMAANNETGVIQPFEEFSHWCKADGGNALYLCDTTQIFAKVPFNFNKQNLDFAVLSGHKIGALTGSGILLCKEPEKLKPLIWGGGQENGLRGGTQNYLGIECLTIAVQCLEVKRDKFNKVGQYKDQFEKELKAKIPGCVIIGDNADRVSNTCLVSLPGIHGQALQIELESNDIFVTTSSACSDNDPSTSKVLKAMGIDDRVGRGVVRISLCEYAEKKDFDILLSALTKAHEKLAKVASF
ncbi:MAG: cysteine desulfurase [Halobacteriovoraceae bacterium]|nr:cysteine desulfurase [Halobacteriovoraceae bacterium]